MHFRHSLHGARNLQVGGVGKCDHQQDQYAGNKDKQRLMQVAS